MHLLKTHSFALALVNRFPSTLWQEALTKLSGPQTKRRHGRRRETTGRGRVGVKMTRIHYLNVGNYLNKLEGC